MAETLQATGVNRDKLWLEWSHSFCDRDRIGFTLSLVNMEHILPPRASCIRPLLSWRLALPGLPCYKLGFLFMLVTHDTSIVQRAHNACVGAGILWYIGKLLSDHQHDGYGQFKSPLAGQLHPNIDNATLTMTFPIIKARISKKIIQPTGKTNMTKMVSAEPEGPPKTRLPLI